MIRPQLLAAVLMLACSLGGSNLDALNQPPKLEYQVTTLQNGLTVILSEDHSTPIVHLELWYHVGSKNEKPGLTGFAHLFEHLMFQGSKNLLEFVGGRRHREPLGQGPNGRYQSMPGLASVPPK